MKVRPAHTGYAAAAAIFILAGMICAAALPVTADLIRPFVPSFAANVLAASPVENGPQANPDTAANPQSGIAPCDTEPAGSEFRVNTYTANSQELNFTGANNIASDPTGNFVVTWTSWNQDGSGYGIYAQRYNAADVAQGDEFRVNTVVADNQFYPSVAMDASGNFVIAWISVHQDGSFDGIYAQRYDAAGAAQGAEFRVNTYTTGNQQYPSVAMDAAGNFVITWMSPGQDGSGWGVYAQRYNDAGVAQGVEFRVNTFTTNDQRYPSAAMDASGNFLVTWTSFGQDGSGNGIYAQRYNDAGVAQGAEFRVNTYTPSEQIYPSVAMDSSGNFAVAWMSFGKDGSGWGIYGQRYNAAGDGQGAELQVNTYTVSDQAFPSIAMTASGNLVVTWESFGQDGSGYGIYAQRYNAAGAPQGTEFRVNTTTTSDQIYSSVAMDGAGNFVVVWMSNGQDGSSWGIYAQRYSVECALPSPEVSILDVTQNEGNAGTSTFTFNVNLSAPAGPGGVTFDIATADGTATVADNDYAAKSLTGQAIAAGGTAYTFSVTVNGDTAFEPSETFFVNVTNVTGATVADGQGQGTITNDDAADPQQTGPTLVVNTTAEPGDGACTMAHCTLREAITLANANADPTTINFNIPGAAPHIINISSHLPSITTQVAINGLSEPDAGGTCPLPGGALAVQVDGSSAAGVIDALTLSSGSSGSSIRGLSITNFGGYGIVMGTSSNNTVTCSYIGLAANGVTAGGNRDGVLIYSGSNDNRVGGPLAGEGNVIANQDASAFFITLNALRNTAEGNIVRDNGTIGFLIGGASGLIDGNIVRGNQIYGHGSHGVLITSLTGETVTNNQILNNDIHNNGANGVQVSGPLSTGNRISQNRIYDNGTTAGLGINLNSDAVTANDPGDPDAGPNNLQNFPVIAAATSDGTNTTVEFTLDSHAGDYTVEFFSNPACDASGNGEGRVYLGSASITLPGTQPFSVTLNTPTTIGHAVTATATDSGGNTSEFSACAAAVPPNTAPTANDDTYQVNEDGTLTEAAPGVLSNDSDNENDPLSAVLVSGPSHGSLTLSPNGAFSYTPNANYFGPDSFTYKVSDGSLESNTATVSITVNAVNDGPEITNTPPASATEDVLYSHIAASSDIDGPGAVWSLVNPAHTCGGSIHPVTGAFSFTPAGPVPPASCVVAIRVCDAGSPEMCATQTTTVEIAAVNDGPVINTTAPGTATEDVAYSYDANVFDPDGPNALWSFDTGHTCGGALSAATGLFTFTPAGPVPPASCVMAIKVCDAGSPELCAAQSQTITIAAVNDAPTIVAAGGITRTQAAGASVSQIAMVADPDNAPNTLTVTVNNGSSATVNGVTVSNIVVNAGGQVSASIAAACGATNASFTLRVTDPGPGSQTVMATLNVTVINETVPPVINPIANVTVFLPPNSPTASMPVSFPLPTATDNCGLVSVTTNPISGSVFQLGTTTVNVTAVDANGNTSTAAFTVTVLYPFTGFTGRVYNPPAINYATAGNMIPMSFSLGGDRGLDIFAPGSPSSQQVNCISGNPIGPVTPASGSSFLIFMGAQYQYYWATDASWAGTCRTFAMTLQDGSTRTLDFRFYNAYGVPPAGANRTKGSKVLPLD